MDYFVISRADYSVKRKHIRGNGFHGDCPRERRVHPSAFCFFSPFFLLFFLLRPTPGCVAARGPLNSIDGVFFYVAARMNGRSRGRDMSHLDRFFFIFFYFFFTSSCSSSFYFGRCRAKRVADRIVAAGRPSLRTGGRRLRVWPSSFYLFIYLFLFLPSLLPFSLSFTIFLLDSISVK